MSNSERYRIARKHNAMSSDGWRYAQRNDKATTQSRSKYGFPTSTNNAGASQALHRASNPSKRPITLPKLPQPKGDYDD